jgi:hypothetical protein
MQASDPGTHAWVALRTADTENRSLPIPAGQTKRTRRCLVVIVAVTAAATAIVVITVVIAVPAALAVGVAFAVAIVIAMTFAVTAPTAAITTAAPAANDGFQLFSNQFAHNPFLLVNKHMTRKCPELTKMFY